MKYELTTTPHPKTHLEITFDRVHYTIRTKSSPPLIQDKIFRKPSASSIINERLRKHAAASSHTGKFSNKYLQVTTFRNEAVTAQNKSAGTAPIGRGGGRTPE